ncbi:MAG TPA: CaiB/BaiF CoA-transferase family protein [Acidimicrobiales bacterium]|nr:CaiB/BaiF CoA-transferase family protein [Acidimicrobiales bacterium]
MPRSLVNGPGPLDGIRVLDFSRVLSGPHAARMLVDMGADVIKVEPPDGDLTRFTYPRVNSISTYFTQQNCGKRNISLDLRRPEALELLVELAAHCDVVIENFRPGVMARMGLGPDALLARNPRLVYASISGYGHTGPWQQRRAYAAVVQAESGVTELEGRVTGIRVNPMMSHGDVYTGLECLAAVLAALYQREHTGRGQWVEVSMAETMLAVNEHAQWEILGRPPERGQVPSFRPGDYPVLTLRSGRRVVVAGHPASDGTFGQYIAAMGREDLRDDPRLATTADRVEHLDVIVDALRAWAAGIDDEAAIEAALEAQGLAMGVLRTVQEVAESEWAEARRAIVAVDDRGGGTVRVPNSPWRFAEGTTGVRGGPAYRGEHNREVFGDLLGIDGAALDRLEADGVLSSRGPSR